MAGGARFRPVMVPPPRFRLPSAFDGAKELPSVSSLAFDGIGVELDSDVFSADPGGGRERAGSSLMVGGEDDFASDGKRERRSEGRRNTITWLFLPPLAR